MHNTIQRWLLLAFLYQTGHTSSNVERLRQVFEQPPQKSTYGNPPTYKVGIASSFKGYKPAIPSSKFGASPITNAPLSQKNTSSSNPPGTTSTATAGGPSKLPVGKNPLNQPVHPSGPKVPCGTSKPLTVSFAKKPPATKSPTASPSNPSTASSPSKPPTASSPSKPPTASSPSNPSTASSPSKPPTASSSKPPTASSPSNPSTASSPSKPPTASSSPSNPSNASSSPSNPSTASSSPATKPPTALGKPFSQAPFGASTPLNTNSGNFQPFLGPKPVIGPPVSPIATLEKFKTQYTVDRILRDIDRNLGQCSHFRAIKGDGNCFYRSVAYSLVENIASIQDPDEKNLQIAVLLSRFITLLDQGRFDESIYGAYTAEFLKGARLSGVKRGNDTLSTYYTNDPVASDKMVILIRLLTSAYYRVHSSELAPFYPHGDLDRAIIRVETLGLETGYGDAQITAKALGIDIHLFRTEGPPLVQRVTDQSTTKDKLTLLFRTGHYDLLYEREI